MIRKINKFNIDKINKKERERERDLFLEHFSNVGDKIEKSDFNSKLKSRSSEFNRDNHFQEYKINVLKLRLRDRRNRHS